jgi:hypothetical protein
MHLTIVIAGYEFLMHNCKFTHRMSFEIAHALEQILRGIGSVFLASLAERIPHVPLLGCYTRYPYFLSNCLISCAYMAKVGLLPANNPEQLPFAHKIFKDQNNWIKANSFKETFSIGVIVDFLGVWFVYLMCSVSYLVERTILFLGTP